MKKCALALGLVVVAGLSMAFVPRRRSSAE